MYSAQISALQERVRVLCGLPAYASDTPIATADILDMSLAATRKLYGLVRQYDNGAMYNVVGPSSLTCTANVNTVSLPATAADVIRLVWVKDSNNEINLNLATLDEMVTNSIEKWTQLVSPRYRIEGGNTIMLYPTPDAAYTLSIYYATDASLITSTSSSVAYRESWDDYVVYWCCIQVRARQEKDASDFWALWQQTEKDISSRLRRDRFGVRQARDLRQSTWREAIKKVLPP